MKNTWVIVANGWRARIFSAAGASEINEIDNLVHIESRLKDQQRTSDRPGDQSGPGGSHHEVEDRRNENEKTRFAKEIGNYLTVKLDQKAYKRLTLICEPKMLGELRKQLPARVQKCITQESSHDLIDATLEEIRDHLPMKVT